MAQDLSMVLGERPGELVSVGEATPPAGVRGPRWVDDFNTVTAAVRGERGCSPMIV
jgi:hypothetical protein